MVKVEQAKDGHCFIQAPPIPGEEPKTWTISRKGIIWLRQHGVWIGQEMGRSNFNVLREKGFVVPSDIEAKRPIAQTKSKAGTNTRKTSKTSKAQDSPKAQASDKHRPGNKNRPNQSPNDQKQRKATSVPVEQGHVSNANKYRTDDIPEHLMRKTKKRDWFSTDKE